MVYMDMAAYSRLVGLDDAGTLVRLRSVRREPAFDEHGGKIVQTGLDSLLIVFDGIDGAVTLRRPNSTASSTRSTF